MRHVCVLLFCLVVSSLVFGQDSKADIFAGYSYLNIDSNGLAARQSANGWEASVAGNFNKWLAVEIEGSGYYRNYDILGIKIGVQDYSYAAGPRLNFKPFFVHALVGGDHLGAGALGVSASQEGLVGAFGGGVQWKVSGPFSVRVSSDYVFSRHNITGGDSLTQNNFRASVGFVYSFGGVRREKTGQRVVPRSHVAATAFPMLALTARTGRAPGAEIVDVAPGGVAAKAGLHTDDVINAVDDKPIQNPAELASALVQHKAGDSVKLGVKISGYWQTETTLVLQ